MQQRISSEALRKLVSLGFDELSSVRQRASAPRPKRQQPTERMEKATPGSGVRSSSRLLISWQAFFERDAQAAVLRFNVEPMKPLLGH